MKWARSRAANTSSHNTRSPAELAYMFTGTTPSAELLAQADAGQLDSPRTPGHHCRTAAWPPQRARHPAALLQGLAQLRSNARHSAQRVRLCCSRAGHGARNPSVHPAGGAHRSRWAEGAAHGVLHDAFAGPFVVSTVCRLPARTTPRSSAPRAEASACSRRLR